MNRVFNILRRNLGDGQIKNDKKLAAVCIIYTVLQ